MALESGSSLNNLILQTGRQFVIRTEGTIANAIAQGVGEEIEKFVSALHESFRDIQAANGIFLEANSILAKGMQDSLLESYKTSVEDRKKFASYRIGENRLSGGKLRNALASPDMVVATPTGIAYINTGVLNREAEHWGRLNFGTGRAGGAPVGAYPWIFRGTTFATLSNNRRASPPFKMPRGVWTESGFYPRSKALNPWYTKGIQARRFFDAGLERFTQDFPRVYGDVVDTFAARALEFKGSSGTEVIGHA